MRCRFFTLRTTRIETVLCVASLALYAGCGDSKPAAEPAAPPAAAEPGTAPAKAPAPAAPAEPKAAAPAAEPTDRVDDPTFELKAVPAGPYKSGAVSSFQVSLTPKGEYHVNQDYPMKISVSTKAGDALSLPKLELTKADAAEFAESVARFDVPFTATAAGAHTVECNVQFAVCTPETCIPDERTLALALPVE
jgi:hypothetical protein